MLVAAGADRERAGAADRVDAGRGAQVDAVAAVQIGEVAGHLVAQGALQRQRRRLEHGDVDTCLARCCRGLQADPAAADDDDRRRGRVGVAKPLAVLDAAQGAGELCAGNVEHAWSCAGGEDRLVVGHDLAAVQLDLVLGQVETLDRRDRSAAGHRARRTRTPARRRRRSNSDLPMRKSFDSGGRSYGGCSSSPTIVIAPSCPPSRRAIAAFAAASPAPMMTMSMSAPSLTNSCASTQTSRRRRASASRPRASAPTSRPKSRSATS